MDIDKKEREQWFGGLGHFCKCQHLSCLWLSQSFLEDRETFGKDKNENKDENKE